MVSKTIRGLARFRHQPPLLASVDAVNAHADQFIDAEVLHAAGAKIADVLRRDIVNAHRYQFIRVGMLVSQGLQPIDEFRGHAVDSKGD